MAPCAGADPPIELVAARTRDPRIVSPRCRISTAGSGDEIAHLSGPRTDARHALRISFAGTRQGRLRQWIWRGLLRRIPRPGCAPRIESVAVLATMASHRRLSRRPARRPLANL